jgi:hypothetical protein
MIEKETPKKTTYELTYNYSTGPWDDDYETSTHLFTSILEMDDLPGAQRMVDLLDLGELEDGETIDIDIASPPVDFDELLFQKLGILTMGMGANKMTYELTYNFKSGGWDDDVETSTHLFSSKLSLEVLPEANKIFKILDIGSLDDGETIDIDVAATPADLDELLLAQEDPEIESESGMRM